MKADLSLLYSAVDATKQAISEGDRSLAEKRGRDMCDCFEANFVVDC